MKKRIWIGILVPAVLAVTLCAPGQAAAAWGTIGSYQPAQALCFNSQIIVSSPLMNAVPVSLGPNVIVIGPSHTQWVAYRAWIYQLESAQWFAGPWKARQTTDDGYSALLDDTWFDYDTGTWQDGATHFTINAGGTYRVYVQYYWFADEYVGAGGDGGFIPLNDYNSVLLGTTAACHF